MKKSEERHFVEALAANRVDLCLSSIRDAERPDFLCFSNGSCVGIEVTRFFFASSGPTPPQAVEGYRRQLSGTLQTEHTRRGLPPLHVSLHLSSDTSLVSKGSRHLLAGLLVDFVEARVPPVGPHVDFDYDSLPTHLSDLGVCSLAILRSAALTKPFWSIPYASFIPESRSSLVQDIVTSKSRLVSEYRKQASYVWLLIVSGSKGLHSMLDLDGDVLSASYASSFDRLFLFRGIGNSIYELKQA